MNILVRTGCFPTRGSTGRRGVGLATISTAGQVSIDERGVLVGGSDLAAQPQAMKNVGLALAAAGATCADIVKMTTYVVNDRPDHRSVVGKARAPFFAGGPPPASTLVGVAGLALPNGWWRSRLLRWSTEVRDALRVFRSSRAGRPRRRRGIRRDCRRGPSGRRS